MPWGQLTFPVDGGSYTPQLVTPPSTHTQPDTGPLFGPKGISAPARPASSRSHGADEERTGGQDPMARINSRIFDLFEGTEHFACVLRPERRKKDQPQLAAIVVAENDRAAPPGEPAAKAAVAQHLPVKTVPSTRTRPGPSAEPQVATHAASRGHNICKLASGSTRCVQTLGGAMKYDTLKLIELLSSSDGFEPRDRISSARPPRADQFKRAKERPFRRDKENSLLSLLSGDDAPLLAKPLVRAGSFTRAAKERRQQVGTPTPEVDTPTSQQGSFSALQSEIGSDGRGNEDKLLCFSALFPSGKPLGNSLSVGRTGDEPRSDR
ncbi:hypothetical protein T484DRAFT_1927158 [Baffinella frigidus]|nr:hypothetical protein T484DRAFT_1927158 [Cryptophyta sp. CCMP2293]